MIRRCLFLYYTPSIGGSFSRSSLVPSPFKRGKKSKAASIERMRVQFEKSLVRNDKLRRKIYDADDNSVIAFSRPLTPHCKSESKKLNAKVMLRERIVCNLLKTEIANLIDAGELGEEVRSLNLTFTRASMKSFNVCQVYWEPVRSSKDLEISETLNKLSSSIRHLLMVNHVMNNVPTIHFYMDPVSYRAAVVEEILEKEGLDVGDEESVENLEKNDFQQSELFGLNHDELFHKLSVLKKSNKVDKS